MNERKKAEERPPARRLTVVDSRGGYQRFLRGMLTHDLVQRGLDFDSAYAAARAVKDRLGDRDEVTTSELRDLVEAQIEEQLGADAVARLRVPMRSQPDLRVIYHGEPQPFSRGLLARSVHAAGLDLDRAYRLVTELEGQLRTAALEEVTSDELARRVGEILERREGAETARRYWLVRRIHNLPRPIVLYIGGASGTGKSTLALDLAPLLRIYRINATDTIRQMMRMVFSPQILPAVHTSSFEPLVSDLVVPRLPAGRGRPSGDPDGDGDGFAARIVANLEEQSTRVCVGVRGVVERAVAEGMSIVVEGVHLYPPTVPFADLEGIAHQVPLMLTIPDAELHRTRFVTRARRGGRRADRYLEAFRGIRIVHEFLLQQAELHETPLLDTSQSDPLVVKTLRVVTSLLERQLPSRVISPWQQPAAPPPTLLLIIDGLADRPVRALGGRTPLQAARTPVLDRLAREGQCGLADPIAPGVVPDTAAGTLAIFGQSPGAMRRGPVEALGAGLEIRAGDVALRGNFATLGEDGLVVDRRAGRIRDAAAELAAAIDRLPLPGALGDEVEVRVAPGTEHRLAVVLRGEGLSSALQGSDPGDAAVPAPPLVPRPDDPRDLAAAATARALAAFEQEARRILAAHPLNAERVAAGLPPANLVLTRGAGRVHRLVPLSDAGKPLRLACISGDRTVLGIAGWLGAETIREPGMTANLDTDLALKLTRAREALERDDLVAVHVKGADIAAHDQRPDRKVAFLERLDRALGEWLTDWERRREGQPAGGLRIAVVADHATLSESGQHGADPLPVLIWGDGLPADEVTTFDELTVARGALHRFPLQLLLSRLYDLT